MISLGYQAIVLMRLNFQMIYLQRLPSQYIQQPFQQVAIGIMRKKSCTLIAIQRQVLLLYQMIQKIFKYVHIKYMMMIIRIHLIQILLQYPLMKVRVFLVAQLLVLLQELYLVQCQLLLQYMLSEVNHHKEIETKQIDIVLHKIIVSKIIIILSNEMKKEGILIC